MFKDDWCDYVTPSKNLGIAKISWYSSIHYDLYAFVVKDTVISRGFVHSVFSRFPIRVSLGDKNGHFMMLQDDVIRGTIQ